MITMMNCDCMEYMAGLPDKAFELALVDPEYGISAGKKARLGVGKKNKISYAHSKIKTGNWDIKTPPDKYFYELFRVSKNQIICGGNYFNLPPTRGIICWDKGACMRGRSFSEWEYIWSSFNCPARLFYYDHTAGLGFVTKGGGEREVGKIHPTQKPVALYKWLLSRYAKPGERILDTHGGSGSICIAAHDLGFDLTWMELDADYYAAACERYKTHAAQATLFQPEEIRQPAPALFKELSQ